MWKKIKERIFPLIITLSALSVAGSAAFYSVFGLSKLFAGASMQVIIMAGSLEFAKLITASLLYQYWGTINKVLKGYLMVAIFTLMIITSGGIYGFLSAAYQSTAVKSELLDKSLAILNQKQIRFQESKEDLIIEKNQLNQSISDLRISLSNPTQVQYYDKEAEQVITTSSSSARRTLQKELSISIDDRNEINMKLESILDSLTTTDRALLNKEISNEEERELGPLKYLSKTTGKDMDTVVNWFLLLIIFVFDPLAIALVVAANFSFSQIPSSTPTFIPKSIRVRQPKKPKLSSPEVIIKEVPVEVEKIVEKEVIKYDDLDLNKDGIISKQEIELAIKELEKEINRVKKYGDDATADLLGLRLQSLKIKLLKNTDSNKKNYW